jgi:PAS domain S-box-containing protein
LVGFALYLVRRPDVGPAVIWALAWTAAFATLVIARIGGDHHAACPGYVLASLFPAMILAGALTYARRAVPSWLLPGALLLGLVRVGLAQSQEPAIAQALALLVEPTLVLAGAWATLGPARASAPALMPRLLPVALVLLALVEALTALSRLGLEDLSTMVTAGWVVIGPLTLGLQIQAVGERGRAELRRARDELEQRVDERTRQLRESEERFRRLVAASFEGIVIHERGVILEVNPALTALFGYRASELIGSPVDRLFRLEERESIRSKIGAGFEGRYEGMALRKDGSIFPVEMEAREVVQRVGTICACALRDVSQRHLEAEERTRLARHMQDMQKLESLGVLAGGIAHDFNNLLTVILGNCRVALGNTELDVSAQDGFRRIRAAGRQAAGLVEQMLTYSGEPSDARVPLDLSRLIAEMLDLLRVSVSEKCKLEPDLASDLPLVDADQSQIRQVVLNLVTNAGEAMGESAGTVIVRTGIASLEASDLIGSFGAADLPAGSYVFAEVSDQGSGMSEETRARVFEPFFTTKFSGRGLGLSSVLGIVRAHGGAISVTSEPSVGSCFRVLLRPSERSARPQSLEHESLGEPSGSGLILVVDDEEEVLEVTRAFLERSGFEVLTAIGGEEGIRLFRAHAEEVDAVVLDLAMPDVDGPETCAEIGRIRPDVPVLITSGYRGEIVDARLAGARVAGFIQKPFEPEDLVARILEITRDTLDSD